MKKYRHLLFDADNTLLDFDATENLALRLLFADQEIPLSVEMENRYKKINQELWKSYEEGKTPRDEVLNTRFSILFKEYGKEINGTFLEQKYRSFLEQGHQLVNGAIELVMELQNDYDLYIVTNGVSNTQHKRLSDSGLYPMFKKIFISEDIGFQKPMQEYFNYVFERIPNFTFAETLIIGDSLSSDIKGGYTAGIDTCWFNPEMKPNYTDIIPTYEVQTLEDILKILA